MKERESDWEREFHREREPLLTTELLSVMREEEKIRIREREKRRRRRRREGAKLKMRIVPSGAYLP